LKSKKGIRDFYNILCSNSVIPTGKKKWNNTFGFSNETWKLIFKLPFIITNNTKLQWLQFRINHHILTTNAYLFKAAIVDSPYCNLCKTEIETIEHVIWQCDKVQDFLRNFKSLTNSLHIPFVFNKEYFMFGIYDEHVLTASVDNIIIIVIKYYVYKTRCFQKPLAISALINAIKETYNVDTHSNSNKDSITMNNFLKKWRKWQPLINSK